MASGMVLATSRLSVLETKMGRSLSVVKSCLGEVQDQAQQHGPQQVEQAAGDREGDAVGPGAAVAGGLDCRLHRIQRDLGHPDANALAVAGQVVIDDSLIWVRLGPDGLPRALQGAGHVRRVSDAVAAGAPEVRQCAVLLWERVLGRAQEVGFPLLRYSKGRGTVALTHEVLHMLEGRIRFIDVFVERAEQVRVAPGRRAEVGDRRGWG